MRCHVGDKIRFAMTDMNCSYAHWYVTLCEEGYSGVIEKVEEDGELRVILDKVPPNKSSNGVNMPEEDAVLLSSTSFKGI